MGAYGRTILAALLMALCGCAGGGTGGAGGAGPSAASEPVWLHDLTRAEVDATKDIVSAHLADPRSAHWGYMMAVRGENRDSVTVCGMVNSKALNGGYAGMRPYRVLLENGAPRLLSLAPAIRLWDQTARANCRPHKGR